MTLKIRTGWSPRERNAVAIARIAEDAGVAALAVHGRTRACAFVGPVEYDTIAAVKSRGRDSGDRQRRHRRPPKARDVLRRTGADALMIGRAAQGRPWIFREIAHFLATGDAAAAAGRRRSARADRRAPRTIITRSTARTPGVRIARKHLGWYTQRPRRRRDVSAASERG